MTMKSQFLDYWEGTELSMTPLTVKMKMKMMRKRKRKSHQSRKMGHLQEEQPGFPSPESTTLTPGKAGQCLVREVRNGMQLRPD